jgi:hypothetical protein
MGYYVRVLSTSSDLVPKTELQNVLEEQEWNATLAFTPDSTEDWTEAILQHADGPEIAAIERNLVQPGSLAEEELDEFAEEVSDCLPANASAWLIDYFKKVQCIYAFQVLSGTDTDNGWEILSAIKARLWNSAPSIMQTDLEGFSNEDGYHILWQFNDSVEGEWAMGVLENGQWTHFRMDLGNTKHREAFLQGKVPQGINPI